MAGYVRSDSLSLVPRRRLLLHPRLLPLPSPHLLLLMLILALLHNVARSQWTTHLRRTSSAESASGLFCTESCDDEARSRAKLTGVVSAFRESEARAAERGLSLIEAVEHYRYDVTTRMELAAGAARNSCEARVLEFRASTEAALRHSLVAANRLAENVSDVFRRAADEQSALSRRLDKADDHLRIQETNLRSIECSLNETLYVLNATRSNIFENERQQVADMTALRFSTLYRFAYIEDSLSSTRTQLNESAALWSLGQFSLNDSLMSLGTVLRQEIEVVSITAESKLLVAQSEILSNVSSLGAAVESELQLTNERVNTSTRIIDKLVTITDDQGFAINHLNQTLRDSETSWRIQMTDMSFLLNSTRSKMERNLSALHDALNSTATISNNKLNAGSRQISELFAIADQQRSAVSHLNRTQQEGDALSMQRAWALSEQLNKTKRELERLLDRHERLSVNHERLVIEARNMSAQLRECPSGWRRNGAVCYFLVTGWNGTWSDARGRCNVLAADFVTVSNQSVNNFLNGYMNSTGINAAWLGATDTASEGVWRWITGEIFRSGSQQIRYANFAIGEPNNNYFGGRSAENCLIMTRSGSWNDLPCALTLAFFCQTLRP